MTLWRPSQKNKLKGINCIYGDKQDSDFDVGKLENDLYFTHINKRIYSHMLLSR